MSTFVGELQREIKALASANGACLGAKYQDCGLLLELVKDLHNQDPKGPHANNPRVGVSDLISAAIRKRFSGEKTEKEIKAKEVFFLTETFRNEFESIEQIGLANIDDRNLISQLLATCDGDELAEIVRKFQNKEAMPVPLHKALSAEKHVTRSKPKRTRKVDGPTWRWIKLGPGSTAQAVEVLSWELADTIAGMQPLNKRIGRLAQQHYEVPGLTFNRIGSTILDPTKRCTGEAGLELTIGTVNDQTILYEEVLSFRGVFDKEGKYRVAIVMSRGAQDKWQQLEDCPSLYYMTDTELFATMLDRISIDPGNVFRMERKDESVGDWHSLDVVRDSASEELLFETARKVEPAIEDLEREQIVVLSCQGDFDNSDRRRLRKTVRLEFPLSDDAVRWRADYPIYLTNLEIDRSAMADIGITVSTSWYMGGPKANLSLDEQIAHPHKVIKRNPDRWVLKDHGLALLWRSPSAA